MICINYFVLITGLELQPMIEKRLDAERVFLISTGSELVVRMLGQIIFIGQKWPDTAQLKDALAAVQYGKLIDGSEIMTGLLIICAV